MERDVERMQRRQGDSQRRIDAIRRGRVQAESEGTRVQSGRESRERGYVAGGTVDEAVGDERDVPERFERPIPTDTRMSLGELQV